MPLPSRDLSATRLLATTRLSRALCLAIALLAALVVANVRFVQLAFEHRGDCVPHVRAGDDLDGGHRAAKSAC